MTPREAWHILVSAELLVGGDALQTALDRLAWEISDRLADRHPLVLTIMGGAIVFAGQLLPRLAFPLECDYVHATRYRDNTRGGDLEWKVLPKTPVQGRCVLVLDDILDEGHTLAAVCEKMREHGAKEVMSAVMLDKMIGRAKPVTADFAGMLIPDRYVFGFGMDVQGAWRNLPAIYALKEE
jgi:hypoxanthine phosphoribosyltransferase